MIVKLNHNKIPLVLLFSSVISHLASVRTLVCALRSAHTSLRTLACALRPTFAIKASVKADFSISVRVASVDAASLHTMSLSKFSKRLSCEDSQKKKKLRVEKDFEPWTDALLDEDHSAGWSTPSGSRQKRKREDDPDQPPPKPVKKTKSDATSWSCVLRFEGDRGLAGIEVWTCKPAVVGEDTANSFRVYTGRGDRQYSLRLRYGELCLLVSRVSDGIYDFKMGDHESPRFFACKGIMFSDGTKGVLLELVTRKEDGPEFKFKLYMNFKGLEEVISAFSILDPILSFSFAEYFYNDVMMASGLAWKAFQKKKGEKASWTEEAPQLLQRLAQLMAFEQINERSLRSSILDQMSSQPDAETRELANRFLRVLQAMV